MYGIYSAAMNEGVPFNSPNVQNAVIANQQATAALRSDLAKQQEKVKLARTACERAQKEYDEAREEAKKQYQEEAATTAKKAAMRIDEARALLQSEAAKQGLVPKDELNSKPGRRYVDDTATIPFDGDIANPDNERIESEEEEQYLNYNTLDDSSRDNAPEPDDAASNGTDSKDYSADFDLKAKSLADVFADISDLSKTKKLDYFVHVTKDYFNELYGIFGRIGDKGLMDSFLGGARTRMRILNYAGGKGCRGRIALILRLT